MKNKDQKIILTSITGSYLKETIEKHQPTQTRQMLQFVLEHKNVRLIDFIGLQKGLENIKFGTDQNSNIDTNKYIQTMHTIAKQKILEIRHILQGIRDPYNPKTSQEEQRVKTAFEQTKKTLPGLDSKDKFLDFIVNVDVDIPEKMKGKKIKGVYCDIDGTLLEYVGIHSGKEGTQKIRKKVVDMLKKYESEGKEIFIWTGGNVKTKKAYLENLGITRPIINKYDYAGAQAEIVLDDTDKESFILQSKIYPETYINTSNFE